MSIFGLLDLETTVQVNEKVRLDASKSFITQGESAISLVEIKPETSGSYVTVSGSGITSDLWYLDWIYTTAATKTVSLRITTNGSPVVFTGDIVVVTVASDALFSSDDAIAKFEPDIKKWLPPGKSTWNFVHRKVQDKILTEIYKLRILANDGTKLSKTEFLDVTEVREWANYMALSIIFTGISNSPDDVFFQKASLYQKKSDEFMQYSLNILAVDYNKDGTLATAEKADFRSGRLVRG